MVASESSKTHFFNHIDEIVGKAYPKAFIQQYITKEFYVTSMWPTYQTLENIFNQDDQNDVQPRSFNDPNYSEPAFQRSKFCWPWSTHYSNSELKITFISP